MIETKREKEVTRTQRKEIEYQFRNYGKNRQTSALYISDHAYDNLGIDYTRVKVNSSQRNSAESRIIREIDAVNKSYLWCKVYEQTLDRFRWTKKDDLMRLKYIARKGVMPICKKIGIERRTYFYWLDEILQIGLMWAKELNLM